MINTKIVIQEFLGELDKYHIKNVLDLGCGKGRISLRFADKGINVKGVDFKDIQISHKNFEFVKKDIREFEFSEKYDLIISSLILHFFRKEESIKIIRKIKENTQEGGFNFLSCLTNEDNLFKNKPENFYPDTTLLKEIYSDWEIIKEKKDFTEIENHDNLGPHNHNIIFLIARKPKLKI